MSTTPLLTQLNRDGFVIIRSILTPSELSQLREAATQVTKLARSGGWPHVRVVGKQFPPWDVATAAEHGIWGVQHLMDPALPGSDLFTATYFSDALLEVVDELLQVRKHTPTDDDNSSSNGNTDLVMELFNMLVAPDAADGDFELRWHRDDVRPEATAEEEMARLVQPAWHAQYNLALWDDASLVVVPESHLRPRTGIERAADPYAAELPGQLVVQLGPGDVVFYNNNILHRGVYTAGAQRATLHGSVGHRQGGALRARNVLQHGVGSWVAKCDLSRLGNGRQRARAESMRDRLVELGTSLGDKGVEYSQEG